MKIRRGLLEFFGFEIRGVGLAMRRTSTLLVMGIAMATECCVSTWVLVFKHTLGFGVSWLLAVDSFEWCLTFRRKRLTLE
jgi:hypothetical protein